MIVDYASLKAAVADTLDRTDLTSQIPIFIQLAEAKFKRDDRCKKLFSDAPSITGDDFTMPTDYKSLDSWYHDGSVWYGPIEIVGADQLPEKKARYGITGAPRYAAIMDGKARFAPAPDVTYATKRSYWLKIVALASSSDTNWLLTDHPDAYLYGSLVHSAPYLKDDDRIGVWEGLLDDALNGVETYADKQQFSGNISVQHKVFGG